MLITIVAAGLFIVVAALAVLYLSQHRHNSRYNMVFVTLKSEGKINAFRMRDRNGRYSLPVFVLDYDTLPGLLTSELKQYGFAPVRMQGRDRFEYRGLVVLDNVWKHFCPVEPVNLSVLSQMRFPEEGEDPFFALELKGARRKRKK